MSRSQTAKKAGSDRPISPVQDAWTCHVCNKVFSDPNSRVLECEHCSLRFCIKCLGKKQSEYETIAKSDCMWFCNDCKPKVTKSVKVDLEIEERVASAMERYETRLDTIEKKTLDAKCNKEQVQAIVKDSNCSLPHSSLSKQNKKLTSDTVKEIADRQAN